MSAAAGHLVPCDWLELQVRWYPSGGQQVGVMVAKLPGEDVTQFIAPAGWHPAPMTLMSPKDLVATYELVKWSARPAARWKHIDIAKPAI